MTKLFMAAKLPYMCTCHLIRDTSKTMLEACGYEAKVLYHYQSRILDKFEHEEEDVGNISVRGK